jgi:hypothetical protein
LSSVETPRIRITVDDQPALTVEQAAARKGVQPKTMSGELTRYKDTIKPVAELDGRKKLYLEEQIDAWWDSRPGKGAPGVAKPHKAGTPARAPRHRKSE